MTTLAILTLLAATAAVTAHVTYRVTVGRIDPATYDAQWTPENRADLTALLTIQEAKASAAHRGQVQAEQIARNTVGLLPQLAPIPLEETQ